MMKLFRKSEHGFSLVELMIVVAIIAILAAIAIPSFMRFAMKSKTSEAFGNLSGIKTCEESYKAENDVYEDCAVAPTGATIDSTPDSWGLTTDVLNLGEIDFEAIGFSPDGDVRYQYHVQDASATTYTAVAVTDLDDDTVTAAYYLIKGSSKPLLDTGGTYSGGDDF